MTASDRAFRALGQTTPEAFLTLLRLFAPDTLPPGAHVTPEHVDDPHLFIAPPPIDADWVARIGDHAILHNECQGYRDTTFPDRLFRYHLSLVLRYPGRRVTTVALWLLKPPEPQSASVIERDHLTLRITSLLLPALPAAPMLDNPLTACFAAGADAGAWTTDELCARVATALRKGKARWEQRHVAVVAATMRGRYKEMVKAMEQEHLGPVIIEDLVKFGEDIGFEKGLEKGLEKGREQGLEKGREQGLATGLEKGLRSALFSTLEVRHLALSTSDRERIQAESSVDRLEQWLRCAVTAGSVADVFSP